ETPLRNFLRTETGSAVVLLAATVLALIWVNVHASSYNSVWQTDLSLHFGNWGVAQDLRHWLNNGLMAFFFFVVGLEARREFDMGELRQRSRLALPLAAGIAGMAIPVAIFLAVNAGHHSTRGWGVAMSTDTAFALGMLALVGPRFPIRLRAFMLTIVVVDDLVALIVIATVYRSKFDLLPLLVAFGLFALGLIAARASVRHDLFYLVLGATTWIAMFKSGIDPVVVGLAMGLLTYAYPVARVDLEHASHLFRLFREQPTPELARSARAGLESAISPNERLQHVFHPWTSYLFVPLFALANAGIVFNGHFLRSAYTSSITLGILIGYVAGKPLGVLAGAWLTTRLSRRRLRPPVGWAAVAGGGTLAGIGFIVALLIASLAFSGTELEQAKLGILSAAFCSALLTWIVFRATALLPRRVRTKALLGKGEAITDLAVPVDPARDHIRGPEDAPITLIEYGDLECPYCGRTETIVRELLADFGDLRYVWRHLPLSDVHPFAQLAAEGAEAAAQQGKFWEMHDLLLGHEGPFRQPDLVAYAKWLELDVERFEGDLRRHAGASKIAEDVDSADLSGVSGTPTFFINERRHHGAYSVATLAAEVRAARARASITR
ncbi:MAG TPA: Na+/H+ antiporter NhaA, partial [Gaiellaceae bacterium]